MANKIPKSLSNISANIWTRQIVLCFESHLRQILSKVPEEDVMVMMTDSLAIQDPGDEKQGDQFLQKCPSVQIALADTLELLAKLNKHWSNTPGNLTQVRKLLTSCLDYNTEVNPRHDKDFPKHLSAMLLKLNLLNDVFIDRDYDDKDRQCLIPFGWTNFVEHVIKKINPLPTVDLKVYGGMYPSIIERMIYSSPYLTSVSISHINITDDLVLALSYSCPCLQQLHIMHCFPWQVISMSAFCSSFFSGASEENVINAMKPDKKDEIKVTFPHLSEVELCYSEMKIAVNFHKYLLYFYENLNMVLSEWRQCLLEDGYGTYTKNVVMPLLSKGINLYFESLFIDGKTLYKSDPEHMRYVAWGCPFIRELRINCSLSECGPIERSVEIFSKRLELLAQESRSISSIHINISESDKVIKEMLLPFFQIRGSQITSLNIEATMIGGRISMDLLFWIFQHCQNITSLKIRVWHRSVPNPNLPNPKVVNDVILPKLEELWIHEEGLGHVEEVEPTIRWRRFIQILLTITKDLYSLSLTLCRELSSLLTELVTDVHCIHIRVIDGFEWQPNLKEFFKFINSQKNLKHLFLEDISGKNFWKIKNNYFNSNLNITWGNFSGWPRS